MKKTNEFEKSFAARRNDHCSECGAEWVTTHWIEILGFGGEWTCADCSGEIIVGKKEGRDDGKE